jgi:hypothetical protein
MKRYQLFFFSIKINSDFSSHICSEYFYGSMQIVATTGIFKWNGNKRPLRSATFHTKISSKSLKRLFFTLCMRDKIDCKGLRGICRIATVRPLFSQSQLLRFWINSHIFTFFKIYFLFIYSRVNFWEMRRRCMDATSDSVVFNNIFKFSAKYIKNQFSEKLIYLVLVFSWAANDLRWFITRILKTCVKKERPHMITSYVLSRYQAGWHLDGATRINPYGF